MSIKISQSIYELLPTGEYPAVIQDIELSDGKFGQQLRWKFALKGRYDGRILTGWTSPALSPNSKLFSWMRAALGGSLIPRDKDF